jgi:tetratricopeptide (TPR) repeat protein
MKEIAETNQLEYYYRLARVYDELNEPDKALSYYQLTIEKGRSSTEYYAARAALQSGYLYEKRGNKSEALKFFNIVLDLDDHEYKNSLDQRAKASINRIRGN